jgi:hypothetical protein
MKDHTPTVGLIGTALSISLENVNQSLAAFSALVAIGYVGTKWFFLIRDRKSKK